MQDNVKSTNNNPDASKKTVTAVQSMQDDLESQHQAQLMKNVKTPEQIKKEITESLKANSASNGVQVAAALLNSIPTPKQQMQTGPKVIRKFEVTLYETDEDASGKMIQKVVNGGKPEIIEASSPAELQEKLQLYKMCGQIPKCREIGQPTTLPGDPAGASNQVKGINMQQVSRRPPKIYKIGGIEIKDDNGKIYQKQWMKLTSDEAKNIRIVNDKTNGVVNLNGKHIEMMKWVQVEDSGEVDTIKEI